MAAASLLETRKLVKEYHHRRVVDQVNLLVESAQVVGMLGPNGAGKTTTFYSIAGFIRPTSGAVYLDNRNITGLPIHERAHRGITYLAQDSSVFKKLTVEENIRIILEPLGLPRNEINNRIRSILEDLKIQHLATHLGGTLSGGERRRVEISRALATRPRFILLDEPFAGVDPLSVKDLKDIIRQLKDRGIGVLISDHNARETMDICDFVYIMHSGRILVSGLPKDVAESEIARKGYLSDDFHL